MHAQRTRANKAEAAAFAAYQATIDLFPGAKAPLLKFLSATTSEFSNDMLTCTNTSVAACLGNTAAANVIRARRNDGSNQDANYACAALPSAALIRERAWQRAPPCCHQTEAVTADVCCSAGSQAGTNILTCAPLG